MNGYPDEDFIQKMLEWRAGAFAQKPDDVSAEEHEAAWIAEEIRFADEVVLKEFKKEIQTLGRETEDLDELVGWKSHDGVERIRREYHRRYLGLEEEARETFEKLVKLLMVQGNLGYSEDENASDQEIFGPETFQAVEVLRKRFSRPLLESVSGNFSTNRSYAIANFWPVLKAAGYGMRAASRVLANAFEKAEKEQGEVVKRANSIYQVIRDLEVR